MKHPLSYVLVLALATGTVALGACSDDSSTGEDDSGGSGGASGGKAGGKTGGSATGGSTSKAGSGGKAGSGAAGTPAEGGANLGGSPDGGAVGSAAGGANSAGAGGGDPGAGGAGGAGGSGLVYLCGSTTTFHKICSALKALDCTNPIECPDCVATWTADNDLPPSNCGTCDDKYASFLNCAVDALESDNLSSAVECVDGTADLKTECYDLYFESDDCRNYLKENACPANWPPT